MSRRWLTLLLLLVLAGLVALAWPRGEADVLEKTTDGWQLPDPMAGDLFEDFSTMPDQEAATLLFPPPPVLSPSMPVGKAHQWGKIALIIDDIGYDIGSERQLLMLPFPLTISVLPQAPHAHQAAEIAHAAGRLVMLHLPMEPVNPRLRRHLDRSFLRLSMPVAVQQQRIMQALAQVPFVQGINNHMGSLLTADVASMRGVMEVCRKQALFFVDSRTIGTSVAAREAKRAGLRWGARQVFLDHLDDPAAIARAWQHARRIAAHRRNCIVIGHPRRNTVAFLRRLRGEDITLLHPLPELLQ
ncbi:MAG: divergent polysaccharide deacetylase family protein [Mariprofundales bacterium]